MNTTTFPKIGEALAGQGGILGAIMRGQNGAADYALIIAERGVGEITGKWGEYGTAVENTTSRFDGPANTAAMAAAGSEIAQRILDLDLEGHKDWYIPAQAEAAALASNVPELFNADGWYWTSTQHSRDDAFFVAFENGYCHGTGKDDEFLVRAVRRAPLQPSNT